MACGCAPFIDNISTCFVVSGDALRGVLETPQYRYWDNSMISTGFKYDMTRLKTEGFPAEAHEITPKNWVIDGKSMEVGIAKNDSLFISK